MSKKSGDLIVRRNITYQTPKGGAQEIFFGVSEAFLRDGLYTYKAKVTDVYDGDTITVDVDFGMNQWSKNVKLRLARINAPEMRPKKIIKIDGKELRRTKHQRDTIKAAAKVSADWLRNEINGKEIIIKTEIDKTDKYKRYIAEIYFGNVNINNELVNKNLAKFKTYK